MTKRVTTRSDNGFGSTSSIDGYTIDIDGAGEETPGTIEHLLATYAACYVPALRVGAEQRDAGDLGSLEIDVAGEVDDNGKLTSVSFDISTDADLSGDQAAAVINRADSLCKVHDALKSTLHAEVSVNGEMV